jgi:hypothetical protein
MPRSFKYFFSCTFLLFFTLITHSLLAADRFVSPAGTDAGPNDCLNAGNPCLTFGHAVAQALGGDRIIAAAGTYNFAAIVDINKTLDIRGAQADQDARTRPNVPANESILTGADGVFSVSANNVIINGFTIQGQTSGLLNGGAVWFKDIFSGYQFINNIVQDNIFGVYANSEGTTQSQFSFNLFQNNNNPGPAGGNGIYSDYGSHNILIDSNNFLNNDNCGIVYDTFLENNTGLFVTNNLFDMNNAGPCIFNSDGITITSNQILNSDDTGLILSVNISNALVQGNELSGNMVQAIRVGSNGSAGTQSNVTILSNQIVDNGGGILLGAMGVQSNIEIHFNRIFNNTNFGLDNMAANASNAENNWWGCNAGPNDGAGDCDTTAGPADFDPWLILRLMANPTSVGSDQTSDLLSDLLENSDGVETSALGHVPDETPVNFSAPMGSVNPSDTGTLASQASSVFSPDGSTGLKQVCTTVDNQTLCTEITVIEPTPTPAPEFFGCLEGSGGFSQGSDPSSCNGFTCSLRQGEADANPWDFALPGLVMGLWAVIRLRDRLWRAKSIP